MKSSIALFVGVLAMSGCASSQTSPTVAEPAAPAQAPSQHGMGHDMADSCPMAVEGTSARAEDVEGGAAMAFTTAGDVAELRRRVAHMADMHEQHHGEGHGAKMGGGTDKDAMGGGMVMPPATARTEEIEGGVRLVFTPKDPADLPKLREHAHQHAEKMASGQCAMMQGHGGPGAHDAH